MGRGFRVYFDVPELGAAIQNLQAFDSRKAARLEGVISASTKQITNDARKIAPKRKAIWKSSQSGKTLRSSIRSKFDKRELAGYVMAKKRSAHLIEFGVKGAIASPKNKKALKFQMPQGKGTGFSQKAKIPARAAQPFMKPAFEKEKPNLINKIEEIYANP